LLVLWRNNDILPIITLVQRRKDHNSELIFKNVPPIAIGKHSLDKINFLGINTGLGYYDYIRVDK